APGGSMVAVPGVGGRTWAWLLDGESLAPLTKIEWMDGDQDRGSNTFVAISPDRQHLLSRTVQDHALRLWNAQTGELLRRLSGHTQSIMYMTFSPDGRFALSGSFDGTARLWDVSTGAETQRFTIPIGGVIDVAFSPDGRFVLTGGTDTKSRLWGVESGEQIRVFAGHEDSVTAVDFSPDGRYVITGSDDNTVRRWRVDLDAVIAVACNQLPRDFTEVERLHYGITDSEPTCPP
ncbi:MAG: WD40 repeat domain-containing protein, partial [Anaerolineales bacterium]|nr:WD40 repeat domain-containing protein [Anaerolineales bacterium]